VFPQAEKNQHAHYTLTPKTGVPLPTAAMSSTYVTLTFTPTTPRTPHTKSGCRLAQRAILHNLE